MGALSPKSENVVTKKLSLVAGLMRPTSRRLVSQVTARPFETPRVAWAVGWEVVQGAQQGDQRAQNPKTSPFTRPERRKSLVGAVAASRTLRRTSQMPFRKAPERRTRMQIFSLQAATGTGCWPGV